MDENVPPDAKNPSQMRMCHETMCEPAVCLAHAFAHTLGFALLQHRHSVNRRDSFNLHSSLLLSKFIAYTIALCHSMMLCLHSMPCKSLHVLPIMQRIHHSMRRTLISDSVSVRTMSLSGCCTNISHMAMSICTRMV